MVAWQWGRARSIAMQWDFIYFHTNRFTHTHTPTPTHTHTHTYTHTHIHTHTLAQSKFIPCSRWVQTRAQRPEPPQCDESPLWSSASVASASEAQLCPHGLLGPCERVLENCDEGSSGKWETLHNGRELQIPMENLSKTHTRERASGGKQQDDAEDWEKPRKCLE